MRSTERHIAGKIEAVAGVAELLAAADARSLVFDPKIVFEPERLEQARNPYSLSKRAKRTGSVPGTATFGIDMCGSGVVGTAPQWVKYLKACGFAENNLKSISIGAITNGPFQHGETITGGTSGATGRVVIKTLTGVSPLLYVSLTGVFQSGETITGATSGATAQTADIPAVAGLEYKLVSEESDTPSLTIGGFDKTTNGALRKLLRGCRGSVAFDFKVNKPGRMNYNFRGVKESVADSALLSGISWETIKGPLFANAALSLGGYAAKIGDVSLDLNNKLAADEDASAIDGVETFVIGDREPGGAMNPRMVPVATQDFYNDWFSDSEKELDFVLPGNPSNKFRFYMPKVQYDKIDDADRDGISLAQISYLLNGALEAGDDELTILAL